MAKGLDELIDWLVDEVAFYGDGESQIPSTSPSSSQSTERDIEEQKYSFISALSRDIAQARLTWSPREGVAPWLEDSPSCAFAAVSY